ncbi:unnamed protein product [Chrysoparadoxa australica]
MAGTVNLAKFDLLALGFSSLGLWLLRTLSVVASTNPNLSLVALGCVLLACVLGLSAIYRARDYIKKPIQGVQRWQVWVLFATLADLVAVSLPGRIDSSFDESGITVKSGFKGMLSPASYTFGVWGPIFCGEVTYSIWQLRASKRAERVLADLAPWYIAAMLCQTMWCFIFMPYLGQQLQFSAGMLALTAVMLAGANGVLVRYRDTTTFPFYIAVHAPLTLHFAWECCASLVNMSSALSYWGTPAPIQLAFCIYATVSATAAGVAITLLRKEPLFGGVIAWALAGTSAETFRQLGGTEVSLAGTALGKLTVEATAICQQWGAKICLSAAIGLVVYSMISDALGDSFGGRAQVPMQQKRRIQHVCDVLKVLFVAAMGAVAWWHREWAFAEP